MHLPQRNRLILLSNTIIHIIFATHRHTCCSLVWYRTTLKLFISTTLSETLLRGRWAYLSDNNLTHKPKVVPNGRSKYMVCPSTSEHPHAPDEADVRYRDPVDILVPRLRPRTRSRNRNETAIQWHNGSVCACAWQQWMSASASLWWVHYIKDAICTIIYIADDELCYNKIVQPR